MHRSWSELKTDTIQSKNDALESPSPLNFITTGSINLIDENPAKDGMSGVKNSEVLVKEDGANGDTQFKSRVNLKAQSWRRRASPNKQAFLRGSLTTGSINLIDSKPKKTSVNVRIDVKTAATIIDAECGIIMKHSKATSDMNSKLPNLEGDVLLNAKG